MITVKVDNAGSLRMLEGLQKQVRFAAAKALTRTAQAVQRAIPQALERELDRPTPFTKHGIFVTRATPTTLTAVVGFKDRQAKYMRLQIEGGSRSPGARGIKLPGNVTLDQYGNIPRGLIAKLIAAARSGKYGKAVKTRLGINAKGRAPSDLSLFYGQPKGRTDLPVGIYRRMPNGLLPVVLFSQKTAKYQPRFKFKELAQRVVKDTFASEFDAALADAMRTAR
jgi:hypothetical protein